MLYSAICKVPVYVLQGYDTVAYATLWCLYMLGLHPEVQEKAYNEVQFATVKNDELAYAISYEDCSSFKYLESVILVKYDKFGVFIENKLPYVKIKCIIYSKRNHMNMVN